MTSDAWYLSHSHGLAVSAAFLVGSFACVHASDNATATDRASVSRSVHQVRFDLASKELRDRTISYTLGRSIQATVTHHVDEIFGVWMITVLTEFENTGGTPLHYAGYVAFLDAQGALLATADIKPLALEKGESWDLPPGQRKKTGKTLSLPFGSIGDIATVQAVMYESTDAIGVRASTP